MASVNDWATWLLEALNISSLSRSLFCWPARRCGGAAPMALFPLPMNARGMVRMLVQAYAGCTLPLMLAFTHPTRFDLVTLPTLILAGAYVAILSLVNVVPGLRQILFPAPTPAPPTLAAAQQARLGQDQRQALPAAARQQRPDYLFNGSEQESDDPSV